MTQDAGAAIAEAFTEEWGRIVATLIARTGDWDLADECAQQAFAEAVRRWPRDGVPRQRRGERQTGGAVAVDGAETEGVRRPGMRKVRAVPSNDRNHQSSYVSLSPFKACSINLRFMLGDSNSTSV